MSQTHSLRGNLDWRRYWIGQAASGLGSQLSVIAYPLLVLAMGGTPVQAGAVASCSLIAQTICRLPAGQLADRAGRRAIMLWMDVVRAVAVGSILVAGVLDMLTYPHLLAVAIIEGCATAVFYPAAAVAIRNLVPREHMTDALALNQSRGAAVSLVGPILGGWFYTMHRLLPFAVDTVSYIVSAILIGRISTPMHPDEPAEAGDQGVLAGIRWLGRQRMLMLALAYAGILNLIGLATDLALIVSLRENGTSSTVIGVILGCVGLGAVVGSVASPWIIKRMSGAALFISTGLVIAATLFVFTFTSSPYVLGPLVVAMFLLAPANGVVVGQMLLTETPANLQGRVVTAFGLLMSGVPALGPALVGVLLSAFGVSSTWLVLAIAAAASVTLCLPLLRAPGFAKTPKTPKAAAEEEAVRTETV